jgi:glyoxylase-like metal-dependent hydrolase (beta-lactamase superfamily II)
MAFVNRADNVYLIDTKMFGFDNYNAAYLVKGKELALIDTGLPNQIEAVRAGIKAHGFSVSAISNIFITHAHNDHCGNVAAFSKECPGAKVYIHPAGETNLTDPESHRNRLKAQILPQMLERFGIMEPVPLSRIQFLKDGDKFDLGNGVKLNTIFAKGHQPSGLVFLEEKNNGLFINDLVGLYLEDCNFSLILNPYGSDILLAMESLKKMLTLSASKLFLGHYGICDKPEKVIRGALKSMQSLLDIGAKCVGEGRPEKIEPSITESKMKEIGKIRAARGEDMYHYLVEELIPHQSTSFSQFYLNLQKK